MPAWTKGGRDACQDNLILSSSDLITLSSLEPVGDSIQTGRQRRLRVCRCRPAERLTAADHCLLAVRASEPGSNRIHCLAGRHASEAHQPGPGNPLLPFCRTATQLDDASGDELDGHGFAVALASQRGLECFRCSGLGGGPLVTRATAEIPGLGFRLAVVGPVPGVRHNSHSWRGTAPGNASCPLPVRVPG